MTMTSNPNGQAAVTTRQEVEDFLYYEAALLDDWKLDEWLTLFTEDARYVVPTTDLPDGESSKSLVLVDDDWDRLQGRVTRLNSRHAHREYPYSRTRRFIANVRITETSGNEVKITASCQVYRVRMGQAAPYVGRYDYTLRRVNGALKIAYRRATLDQDVLRDHGAVSIIL